VTAVAGDASDADALAAIIKGSDAVISALHFDVSAATLLSAVKQAGVGRLLVTGGAASLEVAPGVRVIDTPDFPEEWKGPALGASASSTTCAGKGRRLDLLLTRRADL
jgi:putative NADH-flavin reductase